METRKDTLSNLEVCRFCLSQSETLIPLYDNKARAPKNSVPFALKILACIAIEIFPSDKMPQYICQRCKLFMELSYAFKQLCRQADEAILQYINHGTQISPMVWPAQLNKAFKSCKKSEGGVMKTVVQGGVKVMAEEVTDSEEGEDDNVYNIKIGDGSEDCKSIKIITSVNKHDNAAGSKSRQDSDDAENKDGSLHIIEGGCWACDECESTYPLEQLLAIHKSQKHRKRTEECDDCGRKFFTKYDMLSHKVTHSSDMPFECVVCCKKFRRLLLLKRHEKQVHADMPQHSCVDCPATFLSTDELEVHQMKHNRYTARPFICFICNKGFRNKIILQRHTEFVHNKKPAFSCRYCSQQFASVSKLTRHLREHAGARSYPCRHCGKSFTKSHHYTRHLRLKHQTELTASTYRCDECEATFVSQDELLYHSALHATKNLVCPLCQEKFDDVDAVTAHIKSHVNGSEFMCDFCELIFTSRAKLDLHVAVAHDEELVTYDQETENDESSMDMDADDDDEDNSLKVKEENGHMVVEIKNTDEYMLPASQRDDEDKDQTQSEDSDIIYTDLPNSETDTMPDPSIGINAIVSKQVTIMKTQQDKPNKITSVYKTEGADQPPILMKVEEMKRKALLQSTITLEKALTEKKDKSHMKVESSSAALGASDKSLRLLEKELQDLKRTNTIIEAAKITRPLESQRKGRPQIYSSTPKPRLAEKKDTSAPKSAPEKIVQVEKKSEPGRKVTKDTKELKEVKSNNNNLKEDKELKDKGNGKENKEAIKEDKKEVKDKETPKTAVKNGASETPTTGEDTVRRSTRPSKVKDYAKMIRDSSINSDEESEEEPKEDEPKEVKVPDTPRARPGRPRGTKTQQAAPTPPTPARKRGRPRKEPVPVVPSKIKKDEPSEDDTTDAEPTKVAPPTPLESPPKDTPKESEPANIVDGIKTPEANKIPLELNSNVIISPTGQTLKKIPVKSLPPGVKPLPLPVNSRLPGAREVCEMQIGKKVVKVQKIVMTKAEVEAMAKKGLVEMKDGTMVLKQGIKLPASDPATLKSKLVAQTESKKESIAAVDNTP